MSMKEKDLEGMTVNERLYMLGLMEKFDSAIRSRNKKASESVLIEAKYSEAQASETVAVILNNSTKYDF